MKMKKLADALIRLFLRLAYKVVTALWFFTRPTINGVFIAVWHQNKILIVKNSYRNWYIFPCGGIKRNEDREQAAVRELYEEVGIAVDLEALRYAGNFAERYKYALDNGFFYEIELADVPEIEIDNREVVWARFMKPEEAFGLVLNPLVRTYLLNSARSPLKNNC